MKIIVNGYKTEKGFIASAVNPFFNEK